MNVSVHRSPARGLASLRRLVADRPRAEKCELCAAVIADEHQHLVEPQSGRLLCACDACAILFDDSGITKYRRVPRDVREPEGLDVSDQFWNGLAIPIGLVFFFRASAAGKIMAVYPSPAGPTETTVDEDAWRELAEMHPALSTMMPDVEALMVNRTRGDREYFIVPIDQCYRLTGIIRRHWSGFSGGDDVWSRIREFFDHLKRCSRPERMAIRA